MSEILAKRLLNSVGKGITIFLHNNFRFSGKLLNADEKYIELLDIKSNKLKIIDICEIKELEVEE